jgi:hypothetical protein
MEPSFERALLSRFLRAEAMAMWAVKSARDLAPAPVLAFLKKHEEEEAEHLRLFEGLTGEAARERDRLPALPRQWHALAVHLYGYEALGLEFAKLLAGARPDLGHVLADEEGHVGFFEAEIRRLLSKGGGPARGARQYAEAWMRRLPRTLGRYLSGDGLEARRAELEPRILGAIRARLEAIALLGAV